jgi:AhpD family alkylhydroperoxidase
MAWLLNFALATSKSSLRAKEKEVINLVVSQVNSCDYCLEAHKALGKMSGFSGEQVKGDPPGPGLLRPQT